MRITQAGVYVQIQKYGVEGLLCEGGGEKDASNSVEVKKIISDAATESAEIVLGNAKKGVDEVVKVQLFDHMRIQIVANIVEFRRSLSLHFV